MKLQIKQLSTRERNTLSLALDYYSSYINQINEQTSDRYLELSAHIRNSEVILCTYAYDHSEDDVQVLGKE